jgi:hypothetical protein
MTNCKIPNNTNLRDMNNSMDLLAAGGYPVRKTKGI